MPRSPGVRVKYTCLKKVLETRIDKFSNQSDFAEKAGVHLKTISNFERGKRVSQDNAKEFCRLLELNFREVIEIDNNINLSVQEMRQHIRTNETINHFCGTVRALRMPCPVDLDRIYTRVIFRERRSQLLRDFPRFSLDSVQEAQIKALVAVKNNSKLMLLGRPGSGKTTFLKYLAMQSIEEECVDRQCLEEQYDQKQCIRDQCAEKQLLKKFVPIFVTLKDFAETPDQPSLLSYIESIYKISSIQIKTILDEGQGLILLDGLDEVRETDNQIVVRKIKKFINLFHKNRFIITCRLAVSSSKKFENFIEIEIANFGREQIKDFVTRWFDSQNEGNRAKDFLEKISRKGNEPIQELATNPLLLVLLCLVFQDSNGFPVNRVELYEESLKILLKSWNAQKNNEEIEHWIFRDIIVDHKLNLLSKIAYPNFNESNFFIKTDLETMLGKYIQNFSNVTEIEIDTEELLASIESHYGLLIKQTSDYYSFSHLTFYEYFTARYIFKSNPNSRDDDKLKKLAGQVTNQRWREVILLTVEKLEDSSALLQSLKAEIDGLLAQDEQLQEFLHWVSDKSQSLSELTGNTNQAAIRACYFDFDIAIDYDRRLGWLLDSSFTRDFTCASFIARAECSTVLDTFVQLDQIPNFRQSNDLDHAMAITFARATTIEKVLKTVDQKSEVGQKLHELKKELEDLPNLDDTTAFRNWHQERSKRWGDRLRDVIVSYHSLGENWRYQKFSDRQQNLLREYYNAHLLLLKCLKKGRVNPNLRTEIKGKILLPISI